ncbi:MAG: DUF2520 domain-containing protein [Deltaproteobacteria bacterium]|jgi:predicted short-subunit dehydrogenase-like oxidoreductase (DUF2520 family)|nr:DUF2520 domain-containing protein [Deltaproteobacteria bacterium]
MIRGTPAVETTRELGIFGCGRLGKALGRCLSNTDRVRIGQVRTRSMASARAAVAFLGEGDALAPDEVPRRLDVVLIATPDASIEAVAQELAKSGAIDPGAIAFHCSGALGSDRLASLRSAGASVASVHPVRSFSDPSSAAMAFPGTPCAIEGDEDAIAWLAPTFEACGGRIFEIEVGNKLLYHAGAVLASNALVALLGAAIELEKRIGLDEDDATALLRPLAEGTAAAVFDRGAPSALTGPVSRGDVELVANELETLNGCDPKLAELYRVLARHTVEVARRQQGAPIDRLDAIQALLERLK